ncbi:hypothetical protein HPB47_006590 [Ixodes persulcatus]|uniref:Uncharacterized protein n=1 Tax=Ixodes persulcatus TaxID=34615 RepID=A0AC60P9W4_IXOPE|nr:hypothetical protein HPB47_006590 [Ixodes persulcatus]
MEAFQVSAGPGGLKYLQHHGGVRLMAAVSSIAVANHLVAQGHLMLGNMVVPLEPVGAQLLHVSIYRLPPYVTERAVAQALSTVRKKVEAHFHGVGKLRRTDTSPLVKREPAGDKLPLDTMTENEASINVIQKEDGRLGLSLNAARCCSLHWSGCSPVGLGCSQFLVNGTPIPVIRDIEAFA